MKLQRCLLSLILLVLPCGMVAGGCSISEQQEIDIGKKSHGQFEKEFGGFYPDENVQRYVNAVGMDMARQSGRPNLQWQYRVLNSDQINAFAVPGGYVYITQGLLFRMQNEAQLAGVLGHETTHIAHKHSVKQIENAQGWQVVGLIGSIFGGSAVGDITQIVGSLASMKYGRDQEKDADLTGLKFMTKAGYAPQGMVQVMQILQKSGGGGPPEFLSTHPNPGNRIEYLTDTIKKSYVPAAETGRFGDQDFEKNVSGRRR
jgi:predicted Zn-dependent protease